MTSVFPASEKMRIAVSSEGCGLWPLCDENVALSGVRTGPVLGEGFGLPATEATGG